MRETDNDTDSSVGLPDDMFVVKRKGTPEKKKKKLKEYDPDKDDGLTSRMRRGMFECCWHLSYLSSLGLRI